MQHLEAALGELQGQLNQRLVEDINKLNFKVNYLEEQVNLLLSQLDMRPVEGGENNTTGDYDDVK